MNSLKLKNSFLLLLTAFIWGIAFVVQDSGGDALGPFTFNCLRAFIGGIVLLPTIKILDHAGLTYMKPKTKKECFTTYINHQGEIFKAVNRIHKIKKEAPHH